MAHNIRIPKKVHSFVPYMVLTDKLQQSILTPPDVKRYTLFGWTEEESDAWTANRVEAENLFVLYSDPDKVNSIIRKKMKDLIIKVSKYDHDPQEGHHLLDKVALNGNLDDCATFNVKRSTSLAKVPVHDSGDPMTLIPRLTMKTNSKSWHIIDVDEPTQPDTKGRPKRVLAILIFCAYGTEAPTSLKNFDLIGSAIRGRIKNKIPESELSGSIKKYAYYFARYLTTTGQIGEPGNLLSIGLVP